MKRRSFAQRVLAAGATAAYGGHAPAPAAAQASRPRPNTLMHVGGDYHSVAGAGITSRENLEYNLRHGVKHLTVLAKNRTPETGWDPDELNRMRDDCDKLGVTLEAIRMEPDYILLRKGPERDRAVETIVGNLEKASHVGVGIVTYHWTVIPIRRNRRTTGRGGAMYPGFLLEENWKDLPPGPAGVVNSEDYWERIGYFLEKVVPAAAEFDVRLACHPYDPPGLPFGYQGADNWDSPSIFDAIRRYEAVVESPYNGFQLCLGTVAEGLRHPRTEVLPVVRYLAARGKIYQVHMRNIRGQLHGFEEVYPDEGEMDFFGIMRIFRDEQFSGSICPDHMPHHPSDPRLLQAFAFGYGYIKALIQAVNAEAGGAPV
ncbi:MAG: mannonate dehydratase [Bryobacteraceae bacterium]|nr:mannonate dehydratase [Bryobacteraceae bacterium]